MLKPGFTGATRLYLPLQEPAVQVGRGAKRSFSQVAYRFGRIDETLLSSRTEYPDRPGHYYSEFSGDGASGPLVNEKTCFPPHCQEGTARRIASRSPISSSFRPAGFPSGRDSSSSPELDAHLHPRWTPTGRAGDPLSYYLWAPGVNQFAIQGLWDQNLSAEQRLGRAHRSPPPSR